MKTIFIKLVGDGVFLCTDQINDPETNLELLGDERINYFDAVDEEYVTGEWREYLLFLENLRVYQYDDYDEASDWDNEEGINITKKKGKYIKSKTFFKESGVISPFVFGVGQFKNLHLVYEIEIEDDEEFDPSKLQLIKSDYELEIFPYAIIPEISYNGKKYYFTNDEAHDGVNVDIEYVYKEAQPYA
jgi:hypothetical protein